jgi:hypothetical protein
MYDRLLIGASPEQRQDAAARVASLRPARLHPGETGEKKIIRALFDELELRGVRYCHWKSNARLGDMLAGRDDVDILVDPRDGDVFLVVLLNTGFRLTQSGIGNGHPGVIHALGLDDETAELCDVHAYFQIVSGDSMVKSYRLPIEKALLDRSRTLHGVRVPDPAAELAVFVVRIILKHANAFEARKCGRHYDKVVAETHWLSGQCSADEAAALCTAWFPAIDRPLFDAMLAAVVDPDAVARRRRLGRRAARRLRPLRRLSAVGVQVSRLTRLYAVMERRRTGRRNLSLLSGGAIVALVGPKGTGKSTLGNEVAARLGRFLAVRRIHAGKPPTTLLSWSPLKLKAMLRNYTPGARPPAHLKTGRLRQGRVTLFQVVQRLLLAHDRRQLLQSAARAAASGHIIISDRYPSPTPGATDSTEFDAVAIESAPTPATRRLMALEQPIYAQIPGPDVVLRLCAPLETAILRDAERHKPAGANADEVRRRWMSESLGEFPGAEIVRIDTSGSLEETVRAAVRAVWRAV